MRQPPVTGVETSMKRAAMVLGVAGCGLLGGCLADGNARNVVGTGPVGSILPDVAAAGDRAEKPLTSDAPSIDGLGRSHWAATAIVVPVDGTAAFPTYTKEIRWTKGTSRQRGGPVTPMSALELGGGTTAMQLGEIGASGPLALYDLIASPVRAYYRHPWAEVRRAPHSYWRTTTGVATTVTEPATGEQP